MQGEISKPQSYDLINLRKSIYAPKKAEVRINNIEREVRDKVLNCSKVNHSRIRTFEY